MNQLLRTRQGGYLYCFRNFTLQNNFRAAVFLWFLLGAVQSAQAQCSVTISKVTVSGCYQNAGQSKATVSVEVAWTNAPANDSIKVQLGTAVRYIRPGKILVAYPQPYFQNSTNSNFLYGHQTIVAPQVVAFEIDANSASGSVSAGFVGNSGCAATSTYKAPDPCQPTACGANQLGGIVYRDFNSNGIKENSEMSGVADVMVVAFDCAGTAYGPVKTDASGKYAFPGTSMKFPVRVEFSGLTGVNSSTIYGTGSGTTVQFIQQATCDANLGIINPTAYCQDNVKLFVPCYVGGDPLVVDNTANSAGNADAMVSIPYGVNSSAFVGMEHLSLTKEVGTVWGLGYNRYTKDLFSAANLHRHSGLGPAGLGGVYVTHTTGGTYTTEVFLDVVTDLNINVGTVPSNSARGLVSDKTKPSVDSAVFTKVGKVGIGGLEVSEDGKKLWFINLFDKKLYSVDISAYNTSQTKPTQADVQSYTLPDPGCVGGETRPWAIKVYDDKVYVGLVCDAYTSQNKSNLRAYVYALSGNTFSQVFDFPLTYPKGYGISPLNSTGAAGVDSTGWYPWTDDFKKMIIPITNNPLSVSLIRPQPILSDIDFDIDGSMVLGFADRTGIQGGHLNYPPTGESDTLYRVNPASGDVLRAFYSNGTYILENNGKAGPASGIGINNNQGPGFGEFYDDNYDDGNKYAHTELALGGLTLKPGSGQVVGTTIDPFQASPNSGGVKTWNNANGNNDASYVIYNSSASGTFAKASGLGEPELNCDVLTTLEIGNRVWIDTDKDGVQDACEKALKDVNVALYKGTTLIATTKTDLNGGYYFSQKSKLSTGTWWGTGADTTLLPTTDYKLVFGTGGQTSANGDTLTIAGLGKFLLTQKDATANSGNDLNDSDASKESIAGGSYPTVDVTTGAFGTVNHTFDAGFYCVNPFNYTIKITQATCTGITTNNDAKIELTGIKCADKYAFSKNSEGFTGAAYASATALSGTAVVWASLANPATAAGDTFYLRLYNGLCCYTDTTIILPFKDCRCVKPSVSAAAKNQAICGGETVNPFVATTVPATGITLQWFGPLSDTTGSLGSAIGGAVNASYTPTANFTGKKYFAVVATGIDPSCADTAFVSLTITARPLAKITPPQIICVGDQPSAFTVTPALGVSYAWYGALADTTGSLGTAIAGATSATYTPTGNAISTVGIKYYAVIVTTNQTSCQDTAFVALTVHAKPVAGLSTLRRVLCVGSGALSLTATPSTGVTYAWFGPLADTTSSLGTAISGATAGSYTPTFAMVQPVGTKYFAVVVTNSGTSCKDTAFISITTKLRPNAGITPKRQEICIGELPAAFIATPSTGVTYQWYGPIADTTGAYANTLINGATSASYTPTGAVIQTPGTYFYGVIVRDPTGDGCNDEEFAVLVVNAKPNAGPDYTGGSMICNTVGTVDLPDAANGESWSQLGSSPKAATINASTGVVTGMDAIGTYQFILKNAATGCADTVVVETKNCTKGSLGDYIWKDLDDDGIQEANEPGVKGVIVQLLNGDTGALLSTDTTDANGIYGFTGLDSGNYKVKIVLNSLPSNCQITPKQDAGSPNDDTKDSDFNSAGESPVIVINTLGTGLSKDNPTIDAGLVQPCIQPIWSVTATPVCSPTAATYSVSFSVTNRNGYLKVNAGVLSGSNPYTVTGIPNGTNLIITDSLRANCEFDTTVVAPDCSCPQLTVLTPNATACKGDTLPTLKLFLSGNTAGVGAEWYAAAVGGTALGSGLSFKPSGTIAATDTFYVELTGTTGMCLDQPRTPVIVLAQDCEVDLALKKLINTKTAHIGDTLIYTVKVWNEFVNDASGVEVTDSVATTVGFIANSFVASRGSAVINGNVIKWTIGNIAANGDTVMLTYKVKATQEGIHFNVAEISKTNEKDRDSTPGNGKDDEDDIDRQCFTVPFNLCPTNKIEASVSSNYTNVQWFKDGGTTAIATGNVVLLSDVGTYTFTATNATCPAAGCCPIIIEPGNNCCLNDLCIPFTIKKTKKIK
ncbi:MAG: SdrD B-like domain-containing protein [Spirosomataceae bacterium]